MRLRFLGVAAVALLAAGTLSACRTNVGLAASVDGHEISESQVNSYLRSDGADAKALAKLQAQAQAQNQTLNLPGARSFALEVLIEERLAANSLRKRGGIPSAGQLSKVHDELGSGAQSIEKSVQLSFRAVGVGPKLIPVYVRFVELEVSLARLAGANSFAQLAPYLSKHGGAVKLNPRYGTWDPKTLDVTTTGSAGLPGYLLLQPTAASGS